MCSMNPSELSPEETALLAAAWEIRERALCPYSNFAVGAALQDSEGRTWTGANVENASYNLGLCAERVALYFALTHGARGFRRVAVVTDARAPTPPCGACRQALFEFAGDARVILENRTGERQVHGVRELLPLAFESRYLAR